MEFQGTIFFDEEFFLVLQKLQTLLFSRLTIIEHLKPRYSIWLDIWVFRLRLDRQRAGVWVFDRATAARTNTDLIQLSFARSKINSVYFKHAAGAEAAKKLLSTVGGYRLLEAIRGGTSALRLNVLLTVSTISCRRPARPWPWRRILTKLGQAHCNITTSWWRYIDVAR
jgi:hypothetical protein